jgi:hypothetical protein
MKVRLEIEAMSKKYVLRSKTARYYDINVSTAQQNLSTLCYMSTHPLRGSQPQADWP